MKLLALLMAHPPSLLGSPLLDWQDAASRIPYLKPREIIFDRAPREGAPLSSTELEAVLRLREFARTSPEEKGWALADDPSARIRALALAVAWLQGNPKRLPDFVRHVKDRAPTFPRLRDYSILPKSLDRADAAMVRAYVGYDEQTVGDVATEFVEAYLEAARWPTPGGAYRSNAFEEYWTARKAREHCLSWFKVALQWASQGLLSGPLSEERARLVRKIRAEIDTLDRQSRAWTLLSLAAPLNGSAEPGAAALATETELIATARDLSHETIFELFQGRVASDDPDIRPSGPTAFDYQRVVLFFLTHATDLLQPEDAEPLLTLEEFHRARQAHYEHPSLITPHWAIAAAELTPRRAPEILRSLFTRFAHGKLVDDVFEPQRRAGNETPADAKTMREAVVAGWREAINATLQ